ncbi:MAG: 1-deoxy-D-xylulose-5-phosphate synthase [Gemmatimonadales bacterium]|nr:1-deoxy-D-xylulose-5-phosphate synthase [Gemmatimonadales bacterium]
MEPLLPGIQGPEDLKRLDEEQLAQVCAEIREKIISTVSHTGGHLGASLGVVELTVALHRVLDSPTDKIIWDVGHQTYPHKLLTGRCDQFQTLRTRGGISGFPKQTESPHDMFGVGHASTSISAALGYAVGRDVRKSKHSVVAILGDGALTGGLAYEGLNNAGQAQTDLIVILNDNKMSISPNVGAIARYLTRITSGKHYNRLEADLWDLLGKIPNGSKAQILAGRIKESLKQLIVPTILFEELGFKYFGPLDGHDVPLLIDTLEAARRMGGPILIHILTCKGKGYRFAEEDRAKYHGVGRFDKSEGVLAEKVSVPSYTSVFGDTLCGMAENDSRIHGITAAMPAGTGLAKLRERVPERFHDVGIAEGHAVTFAAGLACCDQRPVVSIYSTFLQRAVDQIIHDVALQKLPVVFAVDRGGLVGEDGPTHHGVFDFAFLRMIPGLVVMAPRDEDQLRHMLATGLERTEGPSALRYPRGSGVGVPMEGDPKPIPIGKGEIMAQGGDVAILAIGSMVNPCLSAAEDLAKAGIGAEVADMRFVKPLDQSLLVDVVSRHSLIVTVEEGCLNGGFGSAILECINQQGFESGPRILNLGIPDNFQEHATRAELLGDLGLDSVGISRRVLEWVQEQDSGRRKAQSAS